MEAAQFLVGVGVILLVSLLLDNVGRRTGLPRVTLLVLVGVLAGPSGFGVIPQAVRDATDLIAVIALTMVAFLLGNELSWQKLQRHGSQILTVSLSVVLATAACVTIGLLALGAPPALALLLGAISTATAPAATQDVVAETGAKGDFRDLLLGLVAIDDVWGLVLFSMAIAFAAFALHQDGTSAWLILFSDLGGAVALGVAIGIPAAYLTGRLKPGRPSQLEAVGFVFLCAGLSLWLETSYLLAGTIAGALTANLATHHQYAFREIEHFEWPFLTIFFVLAGAHLDFSYIWSAGLLGAGYVGFRFAGRMLGGWAGGVLSHLPRSHRNWIGAALMPQAGVAIGMALIAAREFPEMGPSILAIALSGTVIFELVGPLLTRIALRRTEATPKSGHLT